MSILSSTNTGKSSIKVNDKMLNDFGYILESANFSNFYYREYKTFVKNNKKRIYSIKDIKHDSLKYLITIDTNTAFNPIKKYQIKSIDDLNLVDKFLFSKDPKKYKKYKKEIMQKLQIMKY